MANTQSIPPFGTSSLVLNQDGVCGMGLNVSATGTYKRVSTAPPRFEELTIR
jgi:hypothetical protein